MERRYKVLSLQVLNSAAYSMQSKSTDSCFHSLFCFNVALVLLRCSSSDQFFDYVLYDETKSHESYQIFRSCVVSWITNLVIVEIIKSFAIDFLIGILQSKHDQTKISTDTTVKTRQASRLWVPKLRAMPYRRRLTAPVLHWLRSSTQCTFASTLLIAVYYAVKLHSHKPELQFWSRVLLTRNCNWCINFVVKLRNVVHRSQFVWIRIVFWTNYYSERMQLGYILWSINRISWTV